MVRKLLILFAAVVCLCGCDHKSVCVVHPHTVAVRVSVDWEKFRAKEDPTGMTVMVYPGSGEAPVTVLSNTLTHADVTLAAGIYHSVVFNQSTTEFGSLSFRNLEDFSKAEVVAAEAPTKWYTRADNERTAYEPEWFGASRVEGSEVTDEMLEAAARNQIVELVHHTPENVIYTVKVKVHMQNIQNLKSARAALTGMAEGYMLGGGAPSRTQATHLMESWSLVQDEGNPMEGYIHATLTCFGLPTGHTGKAEENELELHLLLADNQTQLSIPFKIGNLFEKAGDGSTLELHLNLTVTDPLPDVEPQDGTAGGFDATVEDWGEEIDHDVNI